MWSIGCVLYEAITGAAPFDESSLCRLFLHVACKNLHEDPLMHPGPPGPQFDYITAGLLRVDPRQRMTPAQFHERAVDELARAAAKANVRQRFSVVYGGACSQNRHSKSFSNFGVKSVTTGSDEQHKHRALSECRGVMGAGTAARR